ncbi:MAG TPA: PIN domain-containing protein [Methylophilaceae bacterium]|nr:PIN domain-containing protein [Methylophilaceae bacterium]
MASKLLLVDFENVQQLDLSGLHDNLAVKVFIGAHQSKLPTDLVKAAQLLGPRLEWVQIEGNGTNALDFHIAMQLGRILETAKSTECWVLSKDKGFDPLLKYMEKLGLKCHRINSFMEMGSRPVDSNDPTYLRVMEILTKLDKRNRPRKLKTLMQHISAMFQKRLSQHEIDKVVDIMFANKKISETNNVLSYEF